MKLLNNLTIFFYTVVCLLFGFLLILLAFNSIPVATLEEAIDVIYTTSDIRLLLGAVGAAIILIGLLIAQFTSSKIQRENTIAFENPDGQVLISLSAIEDLIKRTARQIPDIKDMRPSVVANKKGVNIVNRVVLFAGANIPETTEKIQNIIKTKVQEMLGIEESISVKVHVTKIASSENQKEEKKPEEIPHVFKGIEYGND